MRIRNLLAAASVAVMSATSSFAAVVDLAFIMDRSGSTGSDFANAMDALSLSLANNIPVNNGQDTYTITVVTFADDATTVVNRTVIDSQAALDGVVATVAAQQNSGGLTNYAAAFNALNTAYAGIQVSAKSMINMMTDGQPNEPGSNANALIAAKASATILQGAGWNSLSFESVCDSGDCTSQNNLLAGLGFGPGDTPNDANLLPIYTSGNQITDPLTTPFVLDLPSFAAYNAVIDQKIQRVVTPQVPLPAGLPLMLVGLGAFGLAKRRKQAA